MRHAIWFSVLLVALPAQAQPAKSSANVVPSTSFGFVSVRVSDLHSVEALKPIRESLAKLEKTEFNLAKELGTPLSEIDRLTFFWPAGPDSDPEMLPYILYTTRTPYNEAELLKTLKASPSFDGMRGRARFPGAADDFGRPDVPWPTAPSRPAATKSKGPPPAYEGENPKLGIPPKEFIPLPKRPEPRNPSNKFEPGAAQVGQPPSNPSGPKAAEPAEQVVSSIGPDLFFREHRSYAAFFLLDNRTVLLIPMNRSGPAGLLNFLGQLLRGKKVGPLSEALEACDKHSIVAACRVPPIKRMMESERDFPRDLVPYRSLLGAQTAMITVDLAAKSTASAKLVFAEEALAKRAEPVLKTLIQNGVEGLHDVRKDKSKGPEWNSIANPLLELLAAALDKAEVQADGRFLKARMEMDIGPAVSKALAAFPELIEIASYKAKTMNNLKQIGLAIHNYHDTHNTMPANIVGRDGKVLMSWRVAILPYLEQENIYRSLDLTKAWDDPQNAKVLANMPAVYRVFGRDADRGKTYLQIPSSLQKNPGVRPFLVPDQRTSFASISDGLSNTLMVVEAREAVNWAKPDDLLFDPKQLPKLGKDDRNWFYALFGDGSVRTLQRDKLSDEQLRALMTINGGEVVDLKD